jgi:hypothetical protein
LNVLFNFTENKKHGKVLILNKKIPLQFPEAGIFGAVEKTRTSTRLLGQRPQRCASTNSATTAKSHRKQTWQLRGCPFDGAEIANSWAVGKYQYTLILHIYDKTGYFLLYVITKDRN